MKTNRHFDESSRADESPHRDEGPAAREGLAASEDASSFDRRFKYALIACALLEFIAIALTVYYKVAR